MNNYRFLTRDEIDVLEKNACQAEDWTRVRVTEGFHPDYMHRVMLYGDIAIGAFDRQIEVSKGFYKHTGIYDATLRNVQVGDNCLIENIGNYINNYIIGDNCYISNLSTMETTDEGTFGEGKVISVLNEVGRGNVILFRGLNSQLAALMVKYASNAPFFQAMRQMVSKPTATRDLGELLSQGAILSEGLGGPETKYRLNCSLHEPIDPLNDPLKVSREDRRDVWQPRNDHRRQRPEILFERAPRHSPRHYAQGRRHAHRQPGAREGSEEQGGASVPQG